MTGKLCCRNERAEEQSVFRRCPSLLSLTLMSVLLSPLSLQAADKDGVSFTFGVGPSWGWSATEIKGVDVNGTSTNEIYRYDFK